MNYLKVCQLTAKYLKTSVSPGSTYGECFSVFRDDKTGIEGYTKIDNGIFIVVVKASNEDIDWVTDFSIWDLNKFWKGLRKYYPYGDPKNTKVRIHQGFAKGYMVVRESIHEAFKKSNCSYVFVTGYSMGGGVAPIVALDLQYNFNLSEDKVSCGFCGPRCFNKAGVESFNKRVPKSIFFKYGNDIVTKLPPPMLGFKHAGILKLQFGNKERWWKMSIKDHADFNELVKEIEKEVRLINEN